MSKSFFEHVTNINLAMNEQIRVLKRGGRLVIVQANFLNPFTLFDLLVKYPRRTKGEHGGIKWLFTKSKVRKNVSSSKSMVKCMRALISLNLTF